jgi:hypothetical protein
MQAQWGKTRACCSNDLCLQALENMKRWLFAEGECAQSILSITVGKKGADVPTVLKDRFVACLEELREHIIEGAASMERGDRAFRDHLQTMLLISIRAASDNELMDRVKECLWK